MTKIMTEQEIKDFLEKYCPGTTVEFYSDTIVANNEELGLYPSFNGSETSLNCIAYEYAFVKYAMEKFERLEFPTHIYRPYTGSGVQFSLCGQDIQCDAYIPLVRDEQDEFEITLDKGTRIFGKQHAKYFNDCYQVTISRVDEINPHCSVEYIQKQARKLVDEMLSEFTAYELRED